MNDAPTRDEIRAMFPTKEGFGADVTLAVLAQVPEVAELIRAAKELQSHFIPFSVHEFKACRDLTAAIENIEQKL